MILNETKRYFRDYIEHSADVACLTELRTKLSWLTQKHRISDAVQYFRELVNNQLLDYEASLSLDCGIDLKEGGSLEDLLATLAELTEDTPHLHWVYIDVVLQYAEAHPEETSRFSRAINSLRQSAHERIKGLTHPSRAQKRQRGSLIKSLESEEHWIRKGTINVQQVQRDLEDALHSRHAYTLTSALTLIREWKRSMISGKRLVHAKSKRQASYRLDHDLPHKLAQELLRTDPDCQQISTALSTLARLENTQQIAGQLARLFAEKISQACSRSIGTSLWALGKLDIGRDYAPLFAHALNQTLANAGSDLPNRVTTISSLWSMAALEVPFAEVQPLLEYAKGIDDLTASDVARIFHVAVYYEHEISHWQSRFEECQPTGDTWYARKAFNNGERQTKVLVDQFLLEMGITAHTLLNGYCFGLECDVLVSKNGHRVDVEFDGPIHASKKGNDQFRDTVLTRLGVPVIRLHHSEVPYHSPDQKSLQHLWERFKPLEDLSL